MVKLKRAEEIGELEICARTARNLSQKVLVGKQSPFVQFNLDSVIKQTVSDKRGGRNPQWSDTIIFPILKDQDKILVTIYNRKSKVQSDYIGEVSIDLLPILKEGEKDAWFLLKDRDDYAGDVYIEFTYYKKGESRDRNKVNVASINEIEEGLSILQLKNIRQDPKLNSMELPKDRSINKNTMLNVPNNNNNQVLRKNTNSSQLSFNSENNDTTPTLANENDLVDILDEIRSLVDYPYQLPAQEAPLGPGALPPMRRKPLPKPPNSNRSSNSQLLTPNSNNLSQNDLLLNNNTQSPVIMEHQLQQEMEFNNNHIPILNTNNNQYNVAHFYQRNNSNSNLTRTPSPAPSSQISELVLGDAMNYQRYLSLTGSNSTASLTRRGSLDSIKTGTTMEDYLDHDPTVEIKFNNSKIPSIKRRPLEAPSILQSQNFYNQRTPYPEDVRGRPLMYYQQQQQQQQQLLPLQQMSVAPVPIPLVNNDNTQLTKPLPRLRPIPYPPPSQHHTMIPPPSAHPSHPHHHLSPYTTNLHYPQRPMYHPPTMMEYPPSRFIQQPITNGIGEYSPAPRPMFYSPRALPPPIVSPLIRPHVAQRQLPNPYTNQPRRGSLVD